MNTEKYVFIGGGVSSLVVASKIASDHPNAEVIILERDEELGGLYRSIDYGDYGLFDYGMHLFYETCVPEIDKILNSFLPDEEWIKLSGNKKDIAGIYFKGKMQTYSPYLDIRSTGEENLKEAIDDFFTNLKNKTPADHSSAYSFLFTRYGKVITEKYFAPVFQKLYRTPLKELDILATKITGNDRVILFDPEVMLDYMKDEELRAKLAYADQSTLPAFARPNSQLALYPKKFGMRNFFNSAIKKLEQQKIKIFTRAQLQSFEVRGDRVDSITYTHGSNTIRLDHLKKVFWNAGLPLLAKTLGLPMGKPPSLRNSAYVNIIFDRPVSMDSLYYFYCYDPSFMSFRITNYEAYCPSAATEKRHPICVELWPESEMDADAIFAKAIEELKALKVIDNSHQVRFHKVENTKGGVPIPTLSNMENIDIIRSNIKSKGIQNLVAIGGMAEKNCFFIPDVLRDAFSKV